MKCLLAAHKNLKYWRGAGVVTEQIANLSTRKCRLGSSPSLSAFFFRKKLSGCSVARLSRLLWEQEAAGSNPATPTKKIQSRKWLDFSFEKAASLLASWSKWKRHSSPLARIGFS